MTGHAVAPGFLTRVCEGLTVGAVATHHVIETAEGLGLPGEPVLGRRAAAAGWLTAFTAHLALVAKAPIRRRKQDLPDSAPSVDGRSAVGARARTREAARGFANGAYQALALQHYVDWPWTIRRGLPILTEAEGLPQRLLPAYNAALLATIAASTAAAVSAGRRRPTVIGHLAGLATFPLQLASARHHIGWWRTGDDASAE